MNFRGVLMYPRQPAQPKLQQTKLAGTHTHTHTHTHVHSACSQSQPSAAALQRTEKIIGGGGGFYAFMLKGHLRGSMWLQQQSSL